MVHKVAGKTPVQYPEPSQLVQNGQISKLR